MRPRAPPRALPKGMKAARLFGLFLDILVFVVVLVDLFVFALFVLDLFFDILVEAFLFTFLGSLLEGAVAAGG